MKNNKTIISFLLVLTATFSTFGFAQEETTSLLVQKLKANPLAVMEARRSEWMSGFLLSAEKGSPAVMVRELVSRFKLSTQGEFMSTLFLAVASLEPTGKDTRISSVLLPSKSIFAKPRMTLLIEDTTGSILQMLDDIYKDNSRWKALKKNTAHGITILSEADLPEVSATIQNTPQNLKLAEAYAASAQGNQMFIWLDVEKAIAVVRLFGLPDETVAWLDQAQDVESASLFLTHKDNENSLLCHFKLNGRFCVLPQLLRMIDFSITEKQTKEHRIISANIETDWQDFYSQLWKLCDRIDAAGAASTRNSWKDLLTMSGIGIERDLLQNFTGNFTFKATREKDTEKTSAIFSAGLAAPSKTLRALDRAAIWTGWYYNNSIISTYFEKLSAEGKYRINSTEAANSGYFTVDNSTLAISKDERNRSDNREDNSDTHKLFSLTSDKNSISAMLEWKDSEPVIESLDIFKNGLVELSGITGAEEASTPPAARGLRHIISAEIVYRTLEYGNYSENKSSGYIKDFTRLFSDPGKDGKPLKLIPERIYRASEKVSYVPGGVIYAPARKIDGKPVNWKTECVFMALSRGYDGSPAGIYASGLDGTVYLKKDVTEFPESIPEKFHSHPDWVAVTQEWKK